MKREFALILLTVLSIYSFSQERFIKIDGTDIWVKTMGTVERHKGQPLIVFESGLGTPMDNWERILGEVAKLGPLLTYDRPGIGKSEPDQQYPTIKNVSKTLIKILDHLQLEPPYLLVGHSLGGALIRGFAVYYPELLAGLIMIDPADFTETQQNKREYYRVLGWDDVRIDEELEMIHQTHMSRREQMPKSIIEESVVLSNLRKTDFKEIAHSPIPDIPVHIIVGGRFDMPDQFRSKDYDSELLFRSKMKHRVARWIEVIQSVEKGKLLYSAKAGHFVHFDDPGLVISSVKMALGDYAKEFQEH